MKKYLSEEGTLRIPASLVEKEELANALWLEHFQPEEPLSKEDKAFVLESYNAVADAINSQAGYKRIINITKATKWEPGKGPEKQVATTEVALPEKPELRVQPIAEGQPIKRVGIVQQIIDLHIQGYTNKQIIDMGFNRSTVNRQVTEYKKRNPEIYAQ